MHDTPATPVIDALDRAIILATQAGLPLVHRPYHVIAEQLKREPQEIMERVQRMLDLGIIRRIGVVPNHYAIGYRANGMTVWDVPDDVVDELGEQVGKLDFVTHAYRRPRHLPHWRYNLFAMVHGKSREDVASQIAQIKDLLGEHVRANDVLFSTKILKKTGLRLVG